MIAWPKFSYRHQTVFLTKCIISESYDTNDSIVSVLKTSHLNRSLRQEILTILGLFAEQGDGRISCRVGANYSCGEIFHTVP